MSSGLKTALANNAPLVGYYKFTARTPTHLLAADKLITALGLVRLHSSRIKKPCPRKPKK